MTARHTGACMDVAPTGARVELTGMFFDRLQDGRLIETWANLDLLGLRAQLVEASVRS